MRLEEDQEAAPEPEAMPEMRTSFVMPKYVWRSEA